MNTADPFIRALTGDEGEQTVTLVRSYSATAAEVWNALTTPERIARWYGTIVGTPPRAVGDEFEVEIGEGMIRRALLESCAAPSGLSYTWWSGDGDPGLVTIRLDAIADDETRLTVQHDRLRPHRMTQYGGGWEQNLVALAGVLGAVGEGEEDGDARVGRWELLGGRPSLSGSRSTHRWSGCGRHGPAPRGCRPGGGRTGATSPWRPMSVSAALTASRRRGTGSLWRGSTSSSSPSAGSRSRGRGRDDEGRSRDEAVEVRFTAADAGTVVSVRHTGPWEDDAPVDAYRQGWEFVLAQLAELRALSAAQPRRAIPGE